MSGTVKLQDKQPKTTERNLSDKISLMDEQDLLGVIPKLKTMMLSQLGLLPSGGTSGQVLKKTGGELNEVVWADESGSGGGGVAITTNVVRVDPNEPQVTGKLYHTYEDAMNYIQTQEPASDNQFVIELPGGDFEEDIAMERYVGIRGSRTTLKGFVKQNYLALPDSLGDVLDMYYDNVFISGCTITKIDASNGAFPEFSMENFWSHEATFNEDDVVVFYDFEADILVGIYQSLINNNQGNQPDESPEAWEDIRHLYGIPLIAFENCQMDVQETKVEDPTNPRPPMSHRSPMVLSIINSISTLRNDMSNEYIVMIFNSMIIGGKFPYPFSDMGGLISCHVMNSQLFNGHFKCGVFDNCTTGDEAGRVIFEGNDFTIRNSTLDAVIHRVPINKVFSQKDIESGVASVIHYRKEPYYLNCVLGSNFGFTVEVLIDESSSITPPLLWSDTESYGFDWFVEYPEQSSNYYYSLIDYNEGNQPDESPEVWALYEGFRPFPIWDSESNYSENDVVEHPDRSGQYWLSLNDENIDEPGETNQWTRITRNIEFMNCTLIDFGVTIRDFNGHIELPSPLEKRLITKNCVGIVQPKHPSILIEDWRNKGSIYMPPDSRDGLVTDDVNDTHSAIQQLIPSPIVPDHDSPGRPGQFAFDGVYLYVCVGENQWKRITLEDFST